jgi:hypothetical protein
MMIRDMRMLECSGERNSLRGLKLVVRRGLKMSHLLTLSFGCLSMAAPIFAQTTYYGVQGSFWAHAGSPGSNMKMDYDHVRQRFVVQYNYGSTPPVYGTLDLNTKSFSHFFTGWGTTYYETLLTVLPANWGSYSQGTTFVTRAGGGEIHAVDPSGSATLFASGLPAGGTGPTHYSTVRWDAFGVANHDMFYANEGTGHVVRLNSSGSVVWQTILRDPSTGQTFRPESMIVLGSNPRWGPYQNHVVVGENPYAPASFSMLFLIDPATGSYTINTSPIPRTPESLRLFPYTGSNWALYVSLHGGGIYQLKNFSGIPNLQPGDLFIAQEEPSGGKVYHVYWDSNTNSFVTQLIADFSGLGYLEDMVFAPVPEPSSLLILFGLAGMGRLVHRRRR